MCSDEKTTTKKSSLSGGFFYCDGKILSERFDKIKINEFDSTKSEFMDSTLIAADETTVITTVLDGVEAEITAKGVLEKYYK